MTDPTRTVVGSSTVCRIHTASAPRQVVIQLHVFNSWHISRFPGQVSILLRVDHVLTKETSRNRFSAVSWPISSSCMLYLVSVSLLPHNAMISTRAIRRVTN